MSDPITVTTAVKFRPWNVPNYAVQDVPPRARQEGFSEAPKMSVKELPHQVLDAMAERWLNDLYANAGQRNPFRSERI